MSKVFNSFIQEFNFFLSQHASMNLCTYLAVTESYCNQYFTFLLRYLERYLKVTYSENSTE